MMRFAKARFGMHALHLGFALAVGALALKAAFMPPKGQVTLEPGTSCALDDAEREILVLKDFRVERYPSGKISQYVSDVHIVAPDGEGGRPTTRHALISVNHPLRWKGTWIYQSSYDAEHEAYTVLESVRDPFLPMAVAAGVLLILGGFLFAVRAGRVGRAASRCPVASPCPPASESPCPRSRAPRNPVRRLFAPAAPDDPAWLRAVRYLGATGVVMIPLWIMGKSLLAKELVPALQSPLLVPHVGAYLVSYLILIFAAFGIGRRLMPFGWFLMTLALVLGATWGKICWGDWWQYDPKEMWSLFTWLTYAAYFHFRRYPRWERFFRIAGAVMVILTLTWVNFSRFFTGLHSYA